MKIERLNENQIRCTLTREDLSSREIKLSELMYGSEKIKLLFRDMMQQASDECGFDANNTSLMIEAIPLSLDALVLIITKVEDPEELDGRFARYTAEDLFAEGKEARDNTPGPEALTGADDILDIITRLSKARKALAASKQSAKEKGSAEKSEKKDKAADQAEVKPLSETAEAAAPMTDEERKEAEDAIFHLTRFYLFHDLQTLIHASRVVDPAYAGPNALYKNPDDGNLYLILQKADTTAQDFNKICNALSEYGICVDYTDGLEELFREHMKTILAKDALQTLRTL